MNAYFDSFKNHFLISMPHLDDPTLNTRLFISVSTHQRVPWGLLSIVHLILILLS